MSVPVPMALVTLSSSSSGLVSAVSVICVEMLGNLGTSSAVHSSSLGEVIKRLVTYSIESSSHHITYWNPSKLVEGIFYLQKHYYFTDLKPSICVVLPS